MPGKRHLIGVLLVVLLGWAATIRTAADEQELPGPARLRIGFRVAEGTKLRKIFTRELVLTTQQADSKVDLGTWSDVQRIVFRDEYGVMQDDLPETITRSFETIELEHTHDWRIPIPWGEAVAGAVERAGTGEFAGSRLTFRRDRSEHVSPPDLHEAGYEVALIDGLDPPDEQAERSASLRASADSTGLLPWREVAVGEHWFTGVEAFEELCWPSGGLDFVDADDVRLDTPVDARLGEHLDGTFRIELTAIERVAGVSYARLTLRGNLESRATFPCEWSIEFWDVILAFEGSVSLSLNASLQGHLWWNLDAGHLDSIHIEGGLTVDQGFGDFSWEQWTEFLPEVVGARVWTGKLIADAEFERL